MSHGASSGVDPGVVGDDVRAATQALAGHLRSGMLVLMVDLGHRLGLFEAAAGAGPLTASELAERAGCDARNVEEWLGAVTTGGIFVLHGDGRYELPAAWVPVVTGPGPANVARSAAMVTALAPVVPRAADAVRTGLGLPYEVYRPGFAEAVAAGSGPLFEAALGDGYLAAAPELSGRLAAGGLRCLDVGCGSGHATVVAALAFPGNDWVGVDLDEEAVAAARKRAEAAGATARFEAADAHDLASQPPWDLVTAFDTVHDAADPARLLGRIRAALAPHGVFLMVDVKAHTGVARNLDHPMAPWLYGLSTLHCLQVSLHGGGAGLGTAWGREQAEELLAAAGFDVQVTTVPEDRVNLVYVCRPS